MRIPTRRPTILRNTDDANAGGRLSSEVARVNHCCVWCAAKFYGDTNSFNGKPKATAHWGGVGAVRFRAVAFGLPLNELP